MSESLTNPRNLSIDLARIILMIMVIAFHTVSFGNLNYLHPVASGHPNFLQSHLLASFTVVAVNCYVMISGYVRIKACSGKLAMLLIPVCFYNVLIGIGFSFCDNGIGFFEILFRIPNSITETYWFVESYIVLFLISPFLNKILDGITMGGQFSIIIVGCSLFYVLPMSTFFDLTGGDRGFGIENFAMLYVTGDYLRRLRLKGSWISPRPHHDCVLGFCFYVAFSFLTFLLNAAWATYRHPEDGIQAPFYGYSILTVYLGAVFLLLAFLGLDIRNLTVKCVIQIAAPLAFPVYLIHEQPDIRTRVYDWFSWYDNHDGLWLLFVPLSALLIFLCFASVEWVRKSVFGKLDSLASTAAIELARKTRVLFETARRCLEVRHQP